jgi:hypothetical protein
MRRSRGAFVLSLAVWLSLCSGAAFAAVNNREATRSYLEADLALAKADAMGYGATVTALNELTSRIGAECPGVAAHAPRGRELQEMEVETATAMLMAETAHVRQPEVRFMHVGRSLRWSNKKLTAFAHELASALVELLLPPPNLCADWKGWVASGYSRLTPGARRFLHAIPLITAGYGEAEGESLPDKVSGLLARYENHEDRQLAAAIRRFGRGETAEQIKAVGYAGESVSVTLGLQQRAP